MNQPKLLAILGVIIALVTVWSAIRPLDYEVWFFELLLGFTGIVVLALTYKKYPLSNLLYLLIAAHYVVLAVGAKYTYAEMPLFNWLRDTYDLSRNYYDRVGHFAQGFFPVLIVREFLLRSSTLNRGKMMFFLCVCVCLALSAMYEIMEMGTVLAFYPTSGPEWLGLQGDNWDAQWDMTMCLFGAVLAYAFLRKIHDRSIEQLYIRRAKRIKKNAPIDYE